MPLELNKLIENRYILYRHVASGGMADIYEAQDVIINKPVALKIIKDKYLNNTEFVNQFKNEARYTSIFNHTNIMKIYNVGEHEGVPYVSYELLKGKTLKAVLDLRGKLSFDEVIDFMLQILRGSSEIHSHYILHNDFKPDNLFLLYDGTIRIVDFGAATHLSSKENHILGTVNYLAPEVIQNRKYSVQSDIYSLGIILFELLTGELPFSGSNAQEILNEHANTDYIKISSQFMVSESESFEIVINKAINRYPGSRYKSDKEFMDDLIKIKNHEPLSKKRKLF